MADGIESVNRRLDRAAAALSSLGVRYAVVGGNAVAAWVSRVDAAAKDVFLNRPHAKVRDAIHILWAGEKAVPDAIAATPALHDTVEGEGFHLVPLTDLVRMKLISFRDKDRMHLRDLASVGLVDGTWPAQFPPPLEARLQSILDDPEG